MKLINNLIEQRAIKTYRLKNFAHEFGIFVALAIMVKIGLSFFNGWAGFYLLKNYLASELNSINSAILIAILTLLFIEAFLNLSLTFFFKSCLRGYLKGAIGLALLSMVFFSISFVLTTNGMAQRQGQKADNTSIIIDKYNLQASELKKLAEQNKNSNLEAIEIIKQNPSGWRSGKRDVLQPNQLNEINKYYALIETGNQSLRNDLENLEAQKKQELNENSGNVLIVENRYYKTSVFIMILQVFINGLIMFFFSRVYADSKKEELAKETVKKYATEIVDITDELIKENINQQYIRYMAALRFQLGEPDPKTIPISSNKNNNKIGFNLDNDTTDDNGSVITDDKNKPFVSNKHNALKPRECKYCGELFQPYSVVNVFCKEDCRMNWHRDNNGFDKNKIRFKK